MGKGMGRVERLARLLRLLKRGGATATELLALGASLPLMGTVYGDSGVKRTGQDAVTVELTAVADTSITARVPNFNNGASTEWGVGELNVAAGGPDRSLVIFDLSGIPAGASIHSATLSAWLNAAGNAFADNDATISVYRILSLWGEMTATWNKYDGVNNWGTAGCSNIVTDREAVSVGSAPLQTTDAINSRHDFTLTAGAIEEWLSGVLTNNGILLKTDAELNDMYNFCSRTHATVGQRPKLTIVYS